MTAADTDRGPVSGGLPPVVVDGLVRAHQGDADAIVDVVQDDVVWIDDDERRDGAAEVLEHFLAHGGWREVFRVRAQRALGDDRFVVDWVLWLRADATSYRRDGAAEVVLRNGRITSWTSTASEREDGSLAPWGGD